MAGGSGTRFWPYSRKKYPKQLLNIIGKSNMLQMTVDRLSKIKSIKDIFIVTRQDLVSVIKRNITGVKSEKEILDMVNQIK